MQVLLQEVTRMDAKALTEVFDLYAPAIYKYAFAHCRDAIIADEIVGDAFAKLLEQLCQGKGPNSNIRSYLFEIAHHLIVDEFRRNHRTASIDTVEFSLRAAHYTDMTAEDHMLMDIILGAIKNDLTDHQKHVIILRFMEGFSLKETAKIMGKTVTNIKVTQNRAIAALRKAIDDQPVEYISVEQIHSSSEDSYSSKKGFVMSTQFHRAFA
jgi:RNA polymerase sigma-70 factor, ECF subfamily